MHASPQDIYDWQTVPTNSRRSEAHNESKSGKGAEVKVFCDECEKVLKSKGLLDAHQYSHEENRAKPKYSCNDCDETCSSEDDLESCMNREHDDGTWFCNDCDYQSN